MTDRRPASKAHEPARMTGFVASHVPDRHFEFIKGDDRKSFFGSSWIPVGRLTNPVSLQALSL